MEIMIPLLGIAIILTAFAWGMTMTTIERPTDRELWQSFVMSPQPLKQQEKKEAEKTIEIEQSEPTNHEPRTTNQKNAPANQAELTSEPELSFGWSPARKLAIVRAIKRCAARDIHEDTIVALLDEHQRRDQLQSDVRACLTAQVPAGVVVTLLGGTRQEMLQWIKGVAEEGK